MTAPTSALEFVEGELEVRVDEVLTRTVDTTPWGDSPASVSVEVHAWNESTLVWDDVTSVIIPSGTASIAANVITLPALNFTNGVAGTLYRVTVQFTIAGKGAPFRPFGLLRCLE
jgi:hypothetical protein